MTRQEKITAIGEETASLFKDYKTSEPIAKNHMSYFIIPVAHNVFGSTDSLTLDKAEKLGWTMVNVKVDETKKDSAQDHERVFGDDPTNMNAIKSYIYEHMVPEFSCRESKKERDFRAFLGDFNNILLQKTDLRKNWTVTEVPYNSEPTSMRIELDGIDLWILNKNIAFFTLRTKQSVSDTTSLSDISSKLNRVMREFRTVYVDEGNHTFSNDKNVGTPLVEWLFGLTTPAEEEDGTKTSMLGLSVAELKSSKYSMIYENSYYSKMITAVHIDESTFGEEELIAKSEGEISYSVYDNIDAFQEMPFLLGSTSELFPDQAWENNEEYIYNQLSLGGINIWKNWTGVALHDSLAFFAAGDGNSSGIVHQARNGYYFIYMLNLYINYSLRVFEHKLIDKEFIDIEKIYPLFVEKQRLRNQFMGIEIATRFQPNFIHERISRAMKTDTIYNEIQQNIDNTLALTQKNTDIMITAVLSIFTFSGLWISQDKLFTLFSEYPLRSALASIGVLILVIVLLVNRSKIIQKSKRFRQMIVKKFNNAME